MARRHEIQNLQRRGNVFYWRSRIPSEMVRRGQEDRLSLSLRLSDHRKAGYMARRLNTLLHELRLGPHAMTTTKDQLAALFRAEIERMIAHLDDLALMARRFGNADDPAQLEADIEVGWAYRLLQLFGSRKPLSFEDGCPGRALLLRNGIPEPHVANIAATFLSEQQGMRNGVFEDQVKARMAEFDIPDTVLNREKALTEIFRAKADVLLDVAKRYPMADREKSALTRTRKPNEDERTQPLAEADRVAAGPREAPGNAAAGAGNPEAGREASGAGPVALPPPPQAASREGTRPSDLAGPEEVWARQASPSADGRDGADGAAGPDDPDDTDTQEMISSPGRVLPVGEFMASCETMIANKGEEWTADTAHDARVLVKIFQGILEEHGVADTGAIEQFHVARLRQHFNEIPPRWGQSTRLRALSPRELRETAARQVQMARQAGKPPPKVGLSGATIRRHLGNLDLFLHHLRAEGYHVADWTLKVLRPKKKDKALLRHQQVKPEPEKVRPLFDLPVYTGCKSAHEPHLPGDHVFHGALYFLPMAFAYLGPRRHEMAGLAPDDIIKTPNGWAIHIRTNANRRIKNVQSDRLLPLPDEMKRLGFLDYARAIRALGHTRLFPELYSPFRKDQDPGDRFYKDLRPAIEKSETFNGLPWNGLVHALRHGFADTLKQAGADEAVINDISGRLGNTETQVRYTNPAGLPLIRKAMSHYPAITAHLKPVPIRLLPWVEKKQPPPWAGKGPRELPADGGS